MKKISIVLLVCSALLFSACSKEKKTNSIDSTSKQEAKINKSTESSSVTSSSTIYSSESNSTTISTEQVVAESVSPDIEIEETYEQIKQRTLQSTPAERENWSNKEWEAFGVALSENGLVLDDAGNIISQEQQQIQDQEYTEQDISTDTNTLTGFLNVYGMTPAAYKVQNGMTIEEALRSTPNDMKTSGEIQTGYTEYGIE